MIGKISRGSFPKLKKDAELRGGMSLILVIDDDKGIRSLLRNLLEREGYEVMEAGNWKKC